jgi:hypothetical protein
MVVLMSRGAIIKLGLVLSEDWLNLVLELINTRSRLKPSQVLEYIRKI